jgi:hypothetical protein
VPVEGLFDALHGVFLQLEGFGLLRLFLLSADLPFLPSAAAGGPRPGYELPDGPRAKSAAASPRALSLTRSYARRLASASWVAAIRSISVSFEYTGIEIGHWIDGSPGRVIVTLNSSGRSRSDGRRLGIYRPATQEIEKARARKRVPGCD